MSEQVDKAKKIIYGDRERTYGHPSVNLKRIASYWSIHLGTEVTPVDVCDMMILMKLARLANDPDHEDSRVDIHGYNMLTERLREADNDNLPTLESKPPLQKNYLTPLHKATGESDLSLGQKIALIRVDFVNSDFAWALFRSSHKTGSDRIDNFLSWQSPEEERLAKRSVQELQMLSKADKIILENRLNHFIEVLSCPTGGSNPSDPSAPTNTPATAAPTTSRIVSEEDRVAAIALLTNNGILTTEAEIVPSAETDPTSIAK